MYFVMLNDRLDTPRPMVVNEIEDTVALFNTYQEAEDRAVENPLAIAYGYEIYYWHQE